MAEVIQSLSRQQFEEMWCDLSDMCTEVLTCYDLEQDDTGSPQTQVFDIFSKQCYSLKLTNHNKLFMPLD